MHRTLNLLNCMTLYVYINSTPPKLKAHFLMVCQNCNLTDERSSRLYFLLLHLYVSHLSYQRRCPLEKNGLHEKLYSRVRCRYSHFQAPHLEEPGISVTRCRWWKAWHTQGGWERRNGTHLREKWGMISLSTTAGNWKWSFEVNAVQ